MSGIADLLAKLHAEKAPGVPEAALDAFEAETGLRLPESVLSLYTVCNGAALGAGMLQILPLAEVREYINAMQEFGIPTRWGYFPCTDNDSDPYCVCCAPPLTGYIVQVFHDDSAVLKFRNLDSFLTALTGLSLENKLDFYKMPSEFDGEARTAEDIRIGRELLQSAPELEEVEQGDAYRFGMWLLSGGEISEVVPLLYVGDEYVRDDAMQRLAAISSPEARQALQKAEQDMVRFVEQCAEALHQAGVPAAITNGTTLEAGPRKTGVNVRAYYSMRGQPGIFDDLVERFRRA